MTATLLQRISAAPHLSTATTLSAGPTSATVFTYSPIAPGNFHLSRLDGKPLATADVKAERRARELLRAFGDPTATLDYADGAYLRAVITRSATPADALTFHRTTSREHVSGRWVSRDVFSADTLTVTTTPLDYRTPVTQARHFAPCDPPAADDPRHPDNVMRAREQALRSAAEHRASLAEARRRTRANRRRYAEVPGA